MTTGRLTSTARSKAFAIFNPWWVVIGIGIGLLIQFIGGVVGSALLSGFTGYLVMGFVVGLWSDGFTVAEAGVAAFVIAAIDYAMHNLLYMVLGVGFVFSAAYGGVGLVIALLGAVGGEAVQSKLGH